MSFYINFQNGLGVDVRPNAYWANIVFQWGDHHLMRTDGAVMARVIERLKEGRFNFADVPWDMEIRWCISLPVSGEHVNDENRTEDAKQLAEWYLEQIRLGNATVNRDLLFDTKPYHSGKNCCRGTTCDRILHPDQYAPLGSELNKATKSSYSRSEVKRPSRRKSRLHK
ncbi:unnamed protein product [Penicillium salamii]|uniref:Uncharacterized protein n=1 Tax=Penicillium salamii TaxID=1612424 RepID=A0A9W4JE80_9EURO|nr:unnamed protein product [Penicillium salamii]CAG8228163.1 unnamed protein product [Penicillium salamii]CAG8374830.1 unnamed protein product [Penicillium salamii]CAG8383691.1 unnamed protein product [Penicillium salamii]CAG8386904.1 unnamed protein product [Penicillium salamii]